MWWDAAAMGGRDLNPSCEGFYPPPLHSFAINPVYGTPSNNEKENEIKSFMKEKTNRL